MMLLWFALLGLGIIVFFWLVGKLLDAFDRQDRKMRAELDSRWYEERDKAIKGG
jgi:hypothetical protein